ncbi:MAG: CDP-tyvelose epimerase, partial [Deltaproteobacteria bacterium]|nr:CDP-tyvelose epimerase [Deltaproteobacteria bacterium]
QFGRPDQGIFAYWVNAWLRRRPLRYIGFGGTGHQVRDALHPRDLLPVLRRQTRTAPPRGLRAVNLSGGAANTMSLAQLSAWCRHRFGPHEVGSDPVERPFDVPWMVLDPGKARELWGWEPQTPLLDVLEEIAQHAERNPQWLTISGLP